MSKCFRCAKECKKLVLHGEQYLCEACVKLYDSISTDVKEQAEWLVKTTDGYILGPFYFSVLKDLVLKKKIVFLDEVSLPNTDWVLAKEIKALRETAININNDFDEKTIDTDMHSLINKPQPRKFPLRIPPIFNPVPYDETTVVYSDGNLNYMPGKSRKIFYVLSGLLTMFVGLFFYFYYMNSDLELTTKNEKEGEIYNNYYLKARELEEGGLYERAYDYYINTLQISPEHTASLIHKSAIQLFVLSEPDLAETTLLKLYTDIKKGKILVPEEKADILNLLGICNMGRKNYDSAMSYFNKALIIKPMNAYLYYNIGRIFFDTGKYIDAIGFFEKANKLLPLFVESLFYEANSLVKLSKYSEAYKVLSELIDYNPNYREAIILASYCLFKTSQNDEAYKLLSNILSLDPFYSSKVFEPLFILPAVFSIDQEIDYVQKIIDNLSGQEKVVAEHVLYLLYFVKGDYETAYNNINKLTKKYNKAVAYALLGMIAFHQDKFVDARTNISKALKIDYSNDIAHLYAGRLAYDARDWNQAFNHFIKSQLGHEKLSLYAQTLQGDIYLKYNKNEEALSVWKKILSRDPRYSPVWERLINAREY